MKIEINLYLTPNEAFFWLQELYRMEKPKVRKLWCLQACCQRDSLPNSNFCEEHQEPRLRPKRSEVPPGSFTMLNGP